MSPVLDEETPLLDEQAQDHDGQLRLLKKTALDSEREGRARKGLKGIITAALVSWCRLVPCQYRLFFAGSPTRTYASQFSIRLWRVFPVYA